MSRDPRDWQADMDMCEQTDGNSPWSRELLMAEQPDITIYWLQQAKTEKERADQAELLIDNLGGGDRYKYIRHVRKELNDEITLLAEHIIEVEEREQKLKEAIEERLPGMQPVSRELMKRTLATLYPLEREDTP